jgi:hypothetical protein
VSGWVDPSAQNGFEIIAIGAEGGAHGFVSALSEKML